MFRCDCDDALCTFCTLMQFTLCVSVKHFCVFVSQGDTVSMIVCVGNHCVYIMCEWHFCVLCVRLKQFSKSCVTVN